MWSWSQWFPSVKLQHLVSPRLDHSPRFLYLEQEENFGPTNSTKKHLCSDRGSDFSNRHLVIHFYSGSLVISLNHLSLLWPSIAMGSGDITSSIFAIVTIWYQRPWTSHEPVPTQGHSSDGHLVISPGPVATKGHNSDLPISPTSLAEIGTDPHKYLLTTQHIAVMTTGTLELLECLWASPCSFCRAYTVAISNLHRLHICPTSLAELGRSHVK
jgi:hypothetical protein